MQKIKFIDLFAGLGGTRIGFEEACKLLNIQTECVFTSEIQSDAIKIYNYNFPNSTINGDITKIDPKTIPNFDILLAGFPCQPFSTAGKRAEFLDIRGTLFFDIVRIIKDKKPKGFLLENVKGLVTHDRTNKNDQIGQTLTVILETLERLGYNINWEVLDADKFGVPQARKRIYIVGSLKSTVQLTNFHKSSQIFRDIKEVNLPILKTFFTKQLLQFYTIDELAGKTINDKRGGPNNIHSWDIELKGNLHKNQKDLLNILMLERRKKKWAKIKDIKWMDGMPLTLDEIYSFYPFKSKLELKIILEDLVEKGYLRFEHPKDLYQKGNKKMREYAFNKEKGYNIVSGKLSFEFTTILDDNSVSKTIVATEADRIGVIDNGGIRRMSERECFRFFGFPDWYQSNIPHKKLYKLIGNTVVIPVITEVSKKLLKSL